MMDEHSREHDPIVAHTHCQTCGTALRLTWNDMAETHLAPMGPLALIDWIRATALTKFDAFIRVGR